MEDNMGFEGSLPSVKVGEANNPNNIEIPINDSYTTKQLFKQQIKKQIKKKFKIGDVYYLKTQSCVGGTPSIKEFILKKFIYTIKEEKINILILKQISGHKSNVFSLTKADCEMLHVKYEPELQVWPMDINWIHKKNKKQINFLYIPYYKQYNLNLQINEDC